jgi:hypothetical protein
MNSFEALKEYFFSTCLRCREESKIIEFEDLPEKEKVIFNYYDKNKHLLLYCARCKTYNILGFG